MKQRTCKACKQKYTPTRPLQAACSFDCAVKLSQKAALKREHADRRDIDRKLREAKAKLKTRATWIKEAQAAFNAWIRARDYGQPCISCGRLHGGKVNAGHYRSTKAAPELRFHEENVHLQCEPCNTNLSGNILAYRVGLIAKIGMGRLMMLEGYHEPNKYTVDELKAIKAEYSKRARELIKSKEL